MLTVMSRRSLPQIVVAAVFLASAASPLSSSMPIHDTPLTGVWITVDKAAKLRTAIPMSSGLRDMETILSGVQVEERDTITGTGLLGSKYANWPSLKPRLRE